jgi:hypothetical protein
MLEFDRTVLSSQGATLPEGYPVVAQLPPEPEKHTNEISRHTYRRGGEPVMIVVRLVGGADKRYYRDLKQFGGRWLSDPPSGFVPPLYNTDALSDGAFLDEPVFYVETELEADALMKRGVLAITFGSPSAYPRFKEYGLKGRTVIALGSHSEAGNKHACDLHSEYGDLAGWIVSCTIQSPFGQTKPGYRVLDWISDMGSTPYLRDQLLRTCWPNHSVPERRDMDNPVELAPMAPEYRFRVTRPHRGMPKPKQSWVVDGILPATGTAILFGEGGVGKSFIASEIAFAIQNGTDFGGRKTAQGDAVYFAVEDGDGLLRRTLEALDRDTALQSYGILSRELDLSRTSKDTDLLIDDLTEQYSGRQIRLLVVDTLQMALGSAEESSSTDATAIMRNCNRISERLGCLVLVVHHTGKDASRGHRGSSAFHGAATTMLKMEGDETLATVTIEKQKHGPRGLQLGLHLEFNADDRTCRAIIDAEWSLGSAQDKNNAKSVVETALLSILDQHFTATRCLTMPRSEIREHIKTLSCFSGKGEEAVKSQVNRAIDSLRERGEITATRTDLTLVNRGSGDPTS